MRMIQNGSNNQNKIKIGKCNAYTAKETLGYRGRKFYKSVERGAAKTEKTNLQANY